jgi:hypothetical protein
VTDGQSSRCHQKRSFRALLRLSRRALAAAAGVTAAARPPRDGRRDRHRAPRAAAARARPSLGRWQKRDGKCSHGCKSWRPRTFRFFQRRPAHSYFRVSRLRPSRPAALAQESHSRRLLRARPLLTKLSTAEHSSMSRPARFACPLAGGGIGGGREPLGRVHWVAGRAPPLAKHVCALCMSSAVALAP